MIDAGGGFSAGIETTVPGLYTTPAGLVGTVAINQGGTGQTTAAAALTALGAAAQGSHTVKVGDGGGNITFNATTKTKLFSTQLDITVTVPVGLLAVAICVFCQVGPNANSLQAGIDIDGTITAAITSGGASSTNWANTLLALLVGDGASHTFSPQGSVSAGSCTLQNATFQQALIPIHAVLLLGAT